MPISFVDKVSGNQLAATEINQIKQVVNDNEDAMERQHVWQDLSGTVWNALASSRKIRKTLTENTALTITNVFPEWDGLLTVVGNGHTLTINGVAVGLNSSGETLVYATPNGDAGALQFYSNAATSTGSSNSAPVASSVAFTGTQTEGQTLTGTYTYSDVDSDAEGSSMKQWYRSDDIEGTGRTAISGATNSTYVLQTADVGKYIQFAVTPVAATGTTTGTKVYSSYSGAIAAASGGSTTEDLTFLDQTNQTNTAQIFTNTSDTSFSQAVETVLSLAPGENGRYIVDLTSGGDTKFGFRTAMTKGGYSTFIVGVINDGTNVFPLESGSIASFATSKGSATKVCIHVTNRGTTPVFTMQFYTGGSWVDAYTYSVSNNVTLFPANELGANTSAHLDYPKLIKE
jgi:hypothetical protein